MKIQQILVNKRCDCKIPVQPLGNRYYAIYFPTKIEIFTDEGTLIFNVKPELKINYRSGGKIVDMFIDQIGNYQTQVSYLVHDMCYTPCQKLDMEHPVSKELADELLYQMLVYAGMSKWKAKIVKLSVKLFGNSAYYEDDELTEKNSKLFSFAWLS